MGYRLVWKNIQISSGMKFPTFVFFSFQTKNVTIWSCHHLKNIIIFKWNEKCHHLTVSPFEIIYGFSYQFENVTIWICHHLKTFQTSHHIGMKAHFFIFTIFFRPSIHMVTNVTIWVLGLKIFTPVTKKWLSNGDDQKGFTIEENF